jgi:hypothetical protein
VPLSPVQRRVLAALAPHRGPGSWVAGSAVLAPWLSRVPQDIDLHHGTEAAMLQSMAADRAMLDAMGFAAGPPKRSADEIETSFSGPGGAITLNWVHEPALPEGGTLADPVFGRRADHATVIRRKVAMHLESGDDKHARDLREFMAKGPADELPVDLRRMLTQLVARHPGIKAGI